VNGRAPSLRVILGWSAALAAVVIFVAFSARVWHARGPMDWERPYIRAAYRHTPPGARRWQALFEPEPFAFITVGLAVVALLLRRPKLALAGAVGSFVAVVTAENILKPIIDARQRSEWYPWTGPVLHLGSLTFPSGHVTGATACATFGWFLFHRRTPLAALGFALPVVVGWSMIALGLHYPIDVLGGMILGVLGVSASIAATTWLLGPDSARAAVRDARPSGRDPNGSS
jgi:membrane-associated phospholipid phosphatase